MTLTMLRQIDGVPRYYTVDDRGWVDVYPQADGIYQFAIEVEDTKHQPRPIPINRYLGK